MEAYVKSDFNANCFCAGSFFGESNARFSFQLGLGYIGIETIFEESVWLSDDGELTLGEKVCGGAGRHIYDYGDVSV